MTLELHIEKYSPNEGTKTYRFAAGGRRRLRIGRMSSADITLQDLRTSRLQGMLELDGDRLCVRDLGAVQPVFVNGEPLRRNSTTDLYNDDVLQILDTRLRIQWVGLPLVSQPQPNANAGFQEPPLVVAAPAVMPHASLIAEIARVGERTAANLEAHLRRLKEPQQTPAPPKEYYDTRRLVAQLRADSRTSRLRTLLVTLLAIGLAGALVYTQRSPPSLAPRGRLTSK